MPTFSELEEGEREGTFSDLREQGGHSGKPEYGFGGTIPTRANWSFRVWDRVKKKFGTEPKTYLERRPTKMETILTMLRSLTGRVVAMIATWGITYVTANGWVSPAHAAEIGAAVAYALLEVFMYFEKKAVKHGFDKLSPETQKIIVKKMVEAEETFTAPNSGARKKAWVVNQLIALYEASGFDVPWVPREGEIYMLQTLLPRWIEKGMPWMELMIAQLKTKNT